MLAFFALLAIVLFGFGFVFKWLFIVAAIIGLLFILSFFFGSRRR
jgi:hypothetical protein